VDPHAAATEEETAVASGVEGEIEIDGAGGASDPGQAEVRAGLVAVEAVVVDIPRDSGEVELEE